MSKKRKKKSQGQPKPVKCCFECDHCQYIGEGDHICDVNMEIIVCEWEPTDMFYHCGGKEFIEL